MLQFEDLADYKKWLKTIDQLDKANEKFYNNAVKQSELYEQAIFNVRQEATELLKQLGSFKPSRSGGAGVAGFADDVERVRRANNSFTAALERNKQQIEINTASVTAMKKRIADLAIEYNGLDRSEAKNVQRQKEIIAETKQLTQVTTNLIQSNKNAAKAIDVANTSYIALDRTTQKLRADLKAMPGAWDLATGALNKHNKAAVEMQKQIDKNDKALKRMDSSMGLNQRRVGSYGETFKDVGTQLVGFSTAAGAVMLALQGIKGAFAIIQETEGYSASLKAVSRDNDDFARSQVYVTGLADKLGLEYGSLIDSYKNLKAATRDTYLEGRPTEKIYSAIATAGAKLHLSNQAIEGSLRAVSKMVSSGNVQMDELRSELGEHLPGALRLMSEALGISSSKLNKMVEQGQILAVDVLPKFADAVDKAYGLKQGEKVDTMTANLNRLKNEATGVVAAFNNSGTVNSFFSAISNGLSTSLGDIKRWLKDGSVWELLTFFGGKSLTNSNQRRRNVSDAEVAFGNMDAAKRSKELERLKKEEAELAKKYYSAGDVLDFSREVEKQYFEVYEKRRKLLRANRKLNEAEESKAKRDAVIKSKEDIDKNEADLTRFQKQAVRKRTAEIIAMEKQLAADPKNEVLSHKLEKYKELDAQQRQRDKEVSDRLKSQKPNDDTALEALDKQIKSIEATLQKQAMQDLKAGRIIDVDPKLVKKVADLKKQYEAIKDLQERVENGSYNKGVYQTDALKNVDTLDITSEIFTGKTGKRSQVGKGNTALSGEQLAEQDRKRLAAQTETLNKQAGIMQEYSIKREALEDRLAGKMSGLRQSQKDELLNLLTQQEDAEKAGNQKEVENLQRLIEAKKALYQEDYNNRKAVTEKAIEIGTELVNGLFDLEMAKNQERMNALDRQKEFELEAVGDNAAARAGIEKKYEEQRKQIQRKQDLDARNQALFNVAINTAVAVAKAAPNVALQIATGVLGALQASLILAKPLPTYAEGKNIGNADSYAGPAIAGEAGREIWAHDNKVELLSKPTLINVGRKDVILPNYLTERFLNDSRGMEASQLLSRIAIGQAVTDRLNSGRESQQTALLANALRLSGGGNSPQAIASAVSQAVSKLPYNYTTFDERGVREYIVEKNTLVQNFKQRNNFKRSDRKK